MADGALVAVWSVRFVVNPKHRLLWAPVCWAVLAFAVYALVRYRQADVELIARQEFLRSWSMPFSSTRS